MHNIPPDHLSAIPVIDKTLERLIEHERKGKISQEICRLPRSCQSPAIQRNAGRYCRQYSQKADERKPRETLLRSDNISNSEGVGDRLSSQYPLCTVSHEIESSNIKR